MVLSVLVLARSLRFAVPAVVLVGVAPHYLSCWLTWRALSTVLPRRSFEVVDELFYDTYQRYVTFFFEVYNGTKLIFYGSCLPKEKENVLYISNHQSAVDWVVSDMIAIRQGSMGSIRYVLKDGLRYLPWYGFYFAQHGCIYVKKNDENNENRIKRKLRRFIQNRTPLWLVIFPEGTRYNTKKVEVIKQSQEFARTKGFPVFENVLVPRAKATQLSLEEIGSYVDAVYDVTIAYHDPKRPLLPREEGPSLTEFLAEGNQQVHIHLDRISSDEIPKVSSEIKSWLFDRFEKKEKLLASFYDEKNGGKFPGEAHNLSLAAKGTFLPTLGFVTVLALTAWSPKARSLYWKWSLGTAVGTVAYMGVFYDYLQT